MKLKRILTVVVEFMSESLAFALALLAVMRLLGDVSLPWWPIVGILGAVYLVVGAVPTPWVRHPTLVGISAFLVPFAIFGWIGWRIEYSLLFKRIGVPWEDLPRVVLTPANLGTAIFLSACAIVGRRLARRIRVRASARVVQSRDHS